MLPARWYRVCRPAWNPLPARRRPRPCRGPYRGRFRSDNHATVLRLQNTQPKDRRAYNAPYRNPCRPARHREDNRAKQDGETQGQRIGRQGAVNGNKIRPTRHTVSCIPPVNNRMPSGIPCRNNFRRKNRRPWQWLPPIMRYLKEGKEHGSAADP